MNHVTRALAAIPLVGSKVKHQRDDWRELILFVEPRKVFPFAAALCAVLTSAVLRSGIGYLFAILKRIVNDVAHRHRVMDVCLILNAQQNICGFLVLFHDR